MLIPVICIKGYKNYSISVNTMPYMLNETRTADIDRNMANATNETPKYYTKPYLVLSRAINATLNNKTITKTKFYAPDTFALSLPEPLNITLYLFNHSFRIENTTILIFSHTNTTFNITTTSNITLNLNTSYYKSLCYLTNDIWNCIEIKTKRLRLTIQPGTWKLIEKQANIELNYLPPQQITAHGYIKWKQILTVMNYETTPLTITLKQKENTFNLTINKTKNTTITLTPGQNTFTLEFYTQPVEINIEEKLMPVTSLLPSDAFNITISPPLNLTFKKKIIIIKQNSPYTYKNISIDEPITNPTAYIIENNRKHFLNITQDGDYFVIHEEFI